MATTVSNNCPDPSAHTKNSHMQQAASTAALYATNPSKDDHKPMSEKKLSAAGAATSLKYASPRDLPGFPVVGVDSQLSPGVAATTASANQREFSHWKPEKSDSAGRAAILANNYKSSPTWQPEASTASSRAAILAHQDVSKRSIAGKEMSKEGSQAAGFVMRKNDSNIRVHNAVDHGITRNKALIAATGAFTGRKRSESTPMPMVLRSDPQSPLSDALNAASLAHTPPVRQPDHPLKQSSSVRYTGRNFPKEMFTEHPPVSIEVDEKNRQDALRASALSMAKQMYQLQQSQMETPIQPATTTAAAARAHGKQTTEVNQDLRQQALQYVNIQEAAQKLAMERLAKIQTDDSKAYRDYYGYNTSASRNRLSKHLGRRRSSSDSNVNVSEHDEEMSRRIKTQMAAFSNRVAEVDVQKRQKDRETLLAAAEKRVQAQMHEMDEKVFMQTGKIPPAMMEEWERSAHARATLESEARMVNHGKVHIGGGKYIDQSDIDAVAISRIRPTLDEIEEAAIKQRAKDEELRLDQEEKKRQTQMQKQQDAELKAEEKRIKNEEKLASRSRKAEEKNTLRTEKAAQKAKRLEEKRAQKEKRKSKTVVHPDALAGHSGRTDIVSGEVAESNSEPTERSISGQEEVTAEGLVKPAGENEADVTSPADHHTLKTLLNKFKRKSKGPVSEQVILGSNETKNEGAVLEPELETADQVRRSHSISSISSNSLSEGQRDEASEVSDISDAEFEEARDTLDDRLAPQPNFTTEGRMSIGSGPPRDSKFQEQL